MTELLDLARAGAPLAEAADARTRLLIDGFVHQAGPPPTRFAWLALGSHARGELHCASDQDHALVWEDERAAAGGYARDLAATVIAGLAAFGMRPCDGGYMADAWSKSLPEWVATLRGWMFAPTPQSVLDADVFYDLRPLAGGLDAAVLRRTLSGGADSPRLLHGLAVAANAFPVSLGAFGRMPDTVDVKKSGLAPLVMLARLYALQAGSGEVATLARLRSAVTLSADLVERLAAAFEVLTGLRLAHQLAQAERGEPLSDVIEVCDLPRPQQVRLRDALRSIKAAQSVTAVTFRTDL